MGEISEMMLDGDLCQVCGEFMDDGGGFARTCSACMDDQFNDEELATAVTPNETGTYR